MKKVGNFDTRAGGHAMLTLMNDPTTVDQQFGAGRCGSGTRLQGEARHAGDGRQGFTAKAKGRDAVEVGGESDLAGRMTLEAQECLFWRHPLAIIFDDREGFATAGEIHDHPRRPGIQRVLEELLNDRGGTLHHFAGGDLVGDRRVEYADYRHTYFVLAGTTAAQVSSIVWPQCSAQTFSTSPPDTPARCSFLTSPGWRFSACRIR